MADLRPFRALRPRPDVAHRVIAPPYDVVDTAEARVLVEGNPDSFLHVTRPEIGLPDGVEPDSVVVHSAGRAALGAAVTAGHFCLDGAPGFGVYRLIAGRRAQTGVVATAAVGDYTTGLIRTHEETRRDKEDDRTHHIDALSAHDEVVFLLVAPGDPAWSPVADLLKELTAAEPAVDVITEDGVGHQVWWVEHPEYVHRLLAALDGVSQLFVADGHHRSAAAARVAAASPGRPGVDEFPAVIFPGEELDILPYHRLVADLGGREVPDWLRDLTSAMTVTPIGPAGSAGAGPTTRGRLGMYLAGIWYGLTVRDGLLDGAREADPVGRLDVAVLQDFVLGPGLAITDPRSDPRIDFVGGVRGLAELERRVDSGRWAMAFALAPVSVADLVAVAASGRTMPPKSTWFEPKLRSGLFVHPFG